MINVKNMKMKKKFTVSTLLAALAVMSSCSQDADDTFSNSYDAVYLSLSSNVAEVTTRVKGTSWEGNEQIGVSLRGTSNQLWSVDVEGNMSTQTEGIKILWTEDETLTAYTPYSADVTASNRTINFDAANMQDYLWAEAGGIKQSNPTAQLNFEHVMSKLKITVNKPTGATEELSGTIKLIAKTSGEFNTGTGKVTATGSASAIEEAITTGTPVEILLPAQTIENGLIPFQINLSSGNNGESTFYTGNISVESLQQGTQYNYAVSLTTTAASITGATISGFTGEDQEATQVEGTEGHLPAVYRASEAEVQIGDYLMKDGKVLDPSTYNASLLNEVAGVVFYTGSDHYTKLSDTYKIRSTDGKSDTTTPISEHPDFATYMTCTTGLAVALDNAGNATSFGSTESPSSFYSTHFVERASENGISITTNYANAPMYTSTDMVGFHNTNYFKEYVNQGESTIKGYVNNAMAELAKMTELTSGTNSGWFIPSFAEMERLATVINTVTTNLATLGKSLPTLNADGSTGFYWCSTMKHAKSVPHVHYLIPGRTADDDAKSRITSGGFIRPIIAFALTTDTE